MIAPVRKSVVVAAEPSVAFEIFTSGIDSWWPASHSMSGPAFKLAVIESFAGGRWYAQRPDGTEINIGRVLIWEPGRRVVFRWEIGPGFRPDPGCSSELEIRFVAVGARSTRVELEHRGFESIGAGTAGDYRDGLDRGWPVALAHYASELARRIASDRP